MQRYWLDHKRVVEQALMHLGRLSPSLACIVSFSKCSRRLRPKMMASDSDYQAVEMLAAMEANCWNTVDLDKHFLQNRTLIPNFIAMKRRLYLLTIHETAVRGTSVWRRKRVRNRNDWPWWIVVATICWLAWILTWILTWQTWIGWSLQW